MKTEDLRHAFGSVPASFRNDVNETLEGLEEKDMKKRYKMTTLLLAALLVLLLAGTACAAANRLGIFDRQLEGPDPLTPLGDAGQLVKTKLAAVENDLVRLELEEALYDGRRAMLMLRLAPKDPARCALRTDLAGELPEEEYEGRKILSCHLETLAEDRLVTAAYDASDTAEDGGICFWVRLQFAEPAPEHAKGSVTVEITEDGWQLPLDAIAYDLERQGWEKTARLEPAEKDEDGKTARFEVVSARYSSTPVLGLIELDYVCAQELRFVFRTEAGEELPVVPVWTATPYGPGHAPEYQCELETQALDELPGTITIEGWREGKCYGAVECRVVLEEMDSFPVLRETD